MGSRSVRSMEAVELTLPTEAESAREARDALDPLRGAMDARPFGDLKLLVSELVSDAVIAEGDDGEPQIRMRAKLSHDCVRVELEQGAVAYRLLSRQAEPGTAGWGLQLAQRLSDRWGVKRGGRVSGVWIEMYLPGSGQREAA